MSLITVSGEILADQFDRDNVAICHIINATSVKNFGLAKGLGEKYPYADVYSDRKPLYNLNRCRVQSRDELGTVHIFKKNNRPFIIALVAHFGEGKPLEENNYHKACVEKSTDRHFVTGLKKDTLSDRLDALRVCITKLSQQLSSIPINKIYIPAGTGCGLKDDTWEKNINHSSNCSPMQPWRVI